jgi:fucose permease
LIVAAIGARVEPPPRALQRVRWSEASRQILRQRGFATLCLLVLLGAANESTMAGWTSAYLGVSDVSDSLATWLLASHWLGLILGRSVQAVRSSRPQSRVIVTCALAGAAMTAVFVFTPSRAVLLAAPFAIGVVIAGIVPTSLALAGERLAGNAGTLFGLLLTFAQIGGMTLPAVVGAVADRWSIGAGLSLMVVNGLLIAAVAWRAGRR